MTRATRLKGEGDRYLIDRIRAGDSSAYEQLVDRFNGRLLACAARRLSGTGIDPEDAVQDAFVGLLQSLDRLEDVRSLEAYLFRILRNKVADLAGRRPEAHGMQQVPLAAADSESGPHGYEPRAPGATPSSYARREEAVDVRNEVLADSLEATIAELKDERSFRDLKILELLFYSSWKNRDIATAVGTSEPTVTRVKAAALEKLARLVRRHPRMDPSLDLFSAEEDASDLIRSTWRENLLSCLKRSTLGAYALGALEEDWRDYADFHLKTARCEVCAANLEDLHREAREGALPAAQRRERLFASSVGFLKKGP
jgi:RNA polymerase sigma-70 factor (ECF subfamily)